MQNPIGRDNPFGMMVGPIVWGLYFCSVYAVNSLVCRQGFGTAAADWVFAVLTGIALAALAGLAVLNWNRFVPLRDAHDTLHESDPELARMGRRRFLALASLLLAGLSMVATIYVAAPVLLVPNC